MKYEISFISLHSAHLKKVNISLYSLTNSLKHEIPHNKEFLLHKSLEDVII